MGVRRFEYTICLVTAYILIIKSGSVPCSAVNMQRLLLTVFISFLAMWVPLKSLSQNIGLGHVHIANFSSPNQMFNGNFHFFFHLYIVWQDVIRERNQLPEWILASTRTQRIIFSATIKLSHFIFLISNYDQLQILINSWKIVEE